MHDSKYFEENSDGEQVLSSSDDTAVETKNDGVHLSVSIVSRGPNSSEAHTYDADEGFYRIGPDEPHLAHRLDALFRVLSRAFGGGQITRNPGDTYELTVKRDQVDPADESGNVTSRTNGDYTLSPSKHYDALVVLDEVLRHLTSSN